MLATYQNISMNPEGMSFWEDHSLFPVAAPTSAIITMEAIAPLLSVGFWRWSRILHKLEATRSSAEIVEATTIYSSTNDKMEDHLYIPSDGMLPFA